MLICAVVTLWMPAFLFKLIVTTESTTIGTNCNHGIWKRFENGSQGCFCLNGYTGYRCETDFDDCVSSPCRNGATCTDGVASFTCSCSQGFSGSLCENPINHCASRPCLNGGQCEDLDDNYKCFCNVGFFGRNCESDIAVCNSSEYANVVQCFNGGTCVEGVGISFTCRCCPGNEGPRCEGNVDECVSQPCLNNGSCVNDIEGFVCVCPYDWKGLLCEEKQTVCSPRLCSYRGLCVGNDTDHKCFCVPDYHGLECQWQYDECLPEPRCLNGGSCVDGVDSFTCLCRQGFVGSRCESYCDVSCARCTPLPETHQTGRYLSSLTSGFYGSSDFGESETRLSVSFAHHLSSIEDDDFHASSMNAASVSFSRSDFFITGSTVRPIISTAWLTQSITDYYSEHEMTSSFEMSYSSAWTTDVPTPTVFSLVTVDSLSATLSLYSNSQIIDDILETLIESHHRRSTALLYSSTYAILNAESSELATSTHFDSPSFTMPATSSLDSPGSSSSIVELYPSFSTNSFQMTSEDGDCESTIEDIVTSTEGHFSKDFTKFTFSSEDISYRSEFSSSRADDDGYSSSSLYSTSVYWSITSTDRSGHDVSGTASSIDYQSPTLSLSTSSIVLNQSDFDCSVCRNGGTCYSYDNPDGEIPILTCVCPLHYAGWDCTEKMSNVSVPFFTGSSWLVYNFNDTSLLAEGIELRITFQTLFSSGVLLYVDFSNDCCSETFVLLEMNNGVPVLSFSCADKSMITMEEGVRVDDGQRHIIAVGIEWYESGDRRDVVCNVTMQLDHWSPIAGQQHDVDAPYSAVNVYVGGLSHTLDFIETKMGFQGCILQIKVNGRLLNIMNDAVGGAGIYNCNNSVCQDYFCHYSGTCRLCSCGSALLEPVCDLPLSHSSICDSGAHKCSKWSTCVALKHGYRCDCPLRWQGPYCDIANNFTDAANFNGENSFLSFASQNIRHLTTIRLEFLARRGDGVLFYAAHRMTNRSGDFVCISLNDDHVEVRFNLGRSSQATAVLRSQFKINVAGERWHVIETDRRGRNGCLSVDGVLHDTVIAPTGMTLLDTTTHFFLGGLPDLSLMLPSAIEKNPSFFHGCLRQFSVNDRNYNFTDQDAVSGRNIENCDGAVCGREVCLNGGTCISLPTRGYRCVCTPLFTGFHCAEAISCKLHVCNNGGTCIASYTDESAVCDCPVGWAGPHCDTVIRIGTSAYFKGDGYVRLVDDTYPNSDRTQNQVGLMFRSIAEDGLVMWTAEEHNNDDDYMGFGLWKGQLKVVWNLGWYSRTSLCTSQNRSFADSNWHAVIIRRDRRELSLNVDGIVYAATLAGDYVELNTLGVYYLGGFKRGANVTTWTNGHFHRAFIGCLGAVRLDAFKATVVDFSEVADGRNMYECHDDKGDVFENATSRVEGLLDAEQAQLEIE